VSDHLNDIREHWLINHSLKDAVPNIDDLTWVDFDGGIEADAGDIMVRVDDSGITITNKKFGSQLVIPLK
jgi:hypothetical protein